MAGKGLTLGVTNKLNVPCQGVERERESEFADLSLLPSQADPPCLLRFASARNNRGRRAPASAPEHLLHKTMYGYVVSCNIAALRAVLKGLSWLYTVHNSSGVAGTSQLVCCSPLSQQSFVWSNSVERTCWKNVSWSAAAASDKCILTAVGATVRIHHPFEGFLHLPHLCR